MLRNKVKKLLRPVQHNLLFPARHLLQLRSWLASRKGTVILMFHGVLPRIQDSRLQNFALTVEQFRQCLELTLEYHRIVPLQRLMDVLEAGEEPPSNWAVVTFDDGYVNNLEYALPVLREMGNLPATIFVCPELTEQGQLLPDTRSRLAILHHPANSVRVDTLDADLPLGPLRDRDAAYERLLHLLAGKPWPGRLHVAEELVRKLPPGLYERIRREFTSEDLMNWDQLRQLTREPGIEIGAHTLYHVHLHQYQPLEVLKREIVECRHVLESRLDIPIRSFAYPGGAHCPLAREVVREAGYRCALGIMPGEVLKDTDRFLLPRLASSPYSVLMRRVLATAGIGGCRGWWF